MKTIKILNLITNQKSQVIKVDIAKSFWAKMKGLSFKNKIENDGLLFEFKKPFKSSFWMWGMRMPLDILWIKNNRIIGIEENLKPETGFLKLLFPFFIKKYFPPEPIDCALEVSAGFCKKNRIGVNTKILNQSGQASVGYTLILAVIVLAMAALLYSPQVRNAVGDLYKDMALIVEKPGK